MPVGFRVREATAKVDHDYIDRLGKVPVACISDSMYRMFAGGAKLRPIGKAKMAGPAVTVKAAPGDNLMAHKALSTAAPGSIVVIDAGGDLTNAILGERMVAVAIDRKLGGIILNGAIRDAEVLRELPIAIFAAGITHRGPYKNGPGEMNYPIAIEGMVVCAGDVIVGDEDGFVCIPSADVAAVCAGAEKKFKQETDNDPIAADRSWIDASLKRLGCEVSEG
jgi:RraA family protein